MIASTVIGLARNLLRTESTSKVPVIGDSFMLAALSDANLEWARAFRRGGGNQPIVFMREAGFDLVADTALAEAVTTATTDFDVDSATNLDTSGVLVLWDDNMPDIVAYSGKSSNNLTGVTGIGFAHEDNDVVQKLYQLPSNFGSFRRAEGYGDGVRVDGFPCFYTDSPPGRGQFSLYDDGTNKWLWLPRGTTGSCSIFYEKVGSTIDETSDTIDIPEEYKFFAVWRLVELGRSGRGDNVDRVQEARQRGDLVLQHALLDRNVGARIKTRKFASTPRLTRSDVFDA